MREVTATGLTVNEAVEKALRELKATKEEVTIDVIEEGKKGFLGVFGKKQAEVFVKLNKDPVKEAENFLTNVIRKMGIDAKISKQQSGKNITFHLSGEKMAVLIGKRGQTLNSLQYLAQLVANRYTKQHLHITVDAENYREKRKVTLTQLATRIAKQVIKTSKEVSLEPMPSYERKIIHAALSDMKEVKTASVGEEPNRYLVIKPTQKTDSI